VKDEIIFKKAFKDGKCAGITTVYKEIGRNDGWQGRKLDKENNRWLPNEETLRDIPINIKDR
jgi:hypothetical protein